MAKTPYDPSPKSRFRSRGTMTTVTGREYARNTNCSTPNWAANAFQSSCAFGQIETMSDYVVPRFRARVKAGEIFMLPRSYFKIQCNDLGGQGWLVKSIPTSCNNPVLYAEYEFRDANGILPYLSRTTYNGYTFAVVPNPFDEEELQALRTEVATRVLDQRGRADSNLFETLAEMDQTVGMFDRPISKLRGVLADAARAKKAGRFPGYALNGVSNLYLAYRYGIRPILSDIQNIADGLKKPLGKRRQTTRSRGGFERNYSSSSNVTVGIGTATVKTDVTYSATIRGMSLDDIDLSRLEEVGFTGKGLITLPWELVNKSFVADWLLNIGDFLGAMVPAVGWNQLGSCMTEIKGIYVRYSLVGGITNSQPTNFTFLRNPSGSLEVHQLHKARYALPRAGLVVRNDFRFDKFTRAADALALLSQQFRRVF